MHRLIAAILVAVGLLTTLAHTAQGQENIPDYVGTAVNALTSGDEQDLRDLLRFTQVQCEVEREGLSPQPECHPGEEDGTLVDGFPIASCEGRFVRTDEIQFVLDALTTPALQVVDAYRLPADYESFLFRGEFVVIVIPFPEEGNQLASAVYLDDGGIVGYWGGCASYVSGIVDALGVGEPLDLSADTPDAEALPETGSRGSDTSGPLETPASLAAAGLALLAIGGALRTLAARASRTGQRSR